MTAYERERKRDSMSYKCVNPCPRSTTATGDVEEQVDRLGLQACAEALDGVWRRDVQLHGLAAQALQSVSAVHVRRVDLVAPTGVSTPSRAVLHWCCGWCPITSLTKTWAEAWPMPALAPVATAVGVF